VILFLINFTVYFNLILWYSRCGLSVINLEVVFVSISFDCSNCGYGVTMRESWVAAVELPDKCPQCKLYPEEADEAVRKRTEAASLAALPLPAEREKRHREENVDKQSKSKTK